MMIFLKELCILVRAFKIFELSNSFEASANRKWTMSELTEMMAFLTRDLSYKPFWDGDLHTWLIII